MIDFTDCAVNKLKGYGGANGNKINIVYKGISYMLKFPPVTSKSKAMSYTNSCISEYLACHVFASLGIPVQDTLLGSYTDKRGKEKVVVACRDFTADGKKLMEFAYLKNNEALKRIAGRVNMDEITKLIAETPAISPLQKDFYQVMITERREKILDYSMSLLKARTADSAKSK